jgi:hypothetical protein
VSREQGSKDTHYLLSFVSKFLVFATPCVVRAGGTIVAASLTHEGDLAQGLALLCGANERTNLQLRAVLPVL